jgi:hypothetical protein
MRMADADDLVAVDVFNAAQAAGEPVTTALVRRVVDDLLTHPPECGCGRCEAASTARVGDVRNIASSWQRAVAATKTTRNPPNRQRVGSGPDWHIPRLAGSRLTISSNCLSANVVRH